MNVLVVGRPDYISSHIEKMLSAQEEHQVLVMDNLSNGYGDAAMCGALLENDIGDRSLLDELFKQYSIDAVMHFASFIEVGESVRDPGAYFRSALDDWKLVQQMGGENYSNIPLPSNLLDSSRHCHDGVCRLRKRHLSPFPLLDKLLNSLM